MRYGVDLSARELHGALLDAQLLAQVFIELTGGRQIGLELAAVNTAMSRPSGAAGQIAAAPLHRDRNGTGTARPRRDPRPHMASAAELARHREFISKMDSPLWGA